MKVPLSVTSFDENLLIYRNGTVDTVDLPFRPYVLAEKAYFESAQAKIETWTKVPENEEREYLRFEFKKTSDLYEFKKKHNKLESHILANQYLEQLYISQEDFLLQYPHTNDLRVMYFDIEVATRGDGIFPRPVACPIICIGYSVWNYKNDGSREKVQHKIVKGFDADNLSDLNTLNEFLTDIQETDPDVIAGYFSTTFDFPYVLERCEINKLDTSRISRGNRKPTISNNKIIIPGRIHFDIYASNAGVIKDQTLFGIKSRSLKEIARWYKVKRTIFESNNWIEQEMDDIELPDEIQNLLKLLRENPDRLYAYQDDDVFRTEGAGHVYLRNCITLAELMKVPLDSIINMYSSFVPKLFVARNMERLNLINTETNFSKYNATNGSIEQIGTKFQAAISQLFRVGYSPATWKLDFKSQYPSIVMTFGLGPDTTKLISLEPYTGKYTCKKEEKYTWYRLPSTFDKGKYRYDLIVRVENREGFLTKEIKKLMDERSRIKNEMKIASSDAKDALNSQQIAIKVIMNSIFGLMGLKSTKYGDMITATMITGLARWCLIRSMQHVKDNVINCDTDGYIVDIPIDADKETEWLKEELIKKFKIENNYMILELEGDGEAAYFYRPKNYIVLEDNNEYIIHGSSLKSSKAAKIADRAVKLGIEWVFNDKPPEEIIREAFDFSDVPLEDFVERVNLSKEPNEYDDKQDYRVFLAEQVKAKTGQVIGKGDQVSFLVTKNRLPYEEFSQFYRGGRKYAYIGYVEDKSELDMSYYETIVAKALEKFGISREAIMTVDLFNEMPVKKEPLVKGNLNVVPEEDI